MSMRVNSINGFYNKISAVKKSGAVSFVGVSSEVQAKRKKQLEKIGISDSGIEKMSQYSDARYSKAIALLKKGCFEENIEKASRYGEKKTKRAHELLNHQIVDLSLTSLVKLNDKKFARVINLADNGVSSECLDLFSQLNTSELAEAIKMMKAGYTPIRAVYMSKLSKDEQEIFENLIKGCISPDTAYDITTIEDEEEMCRVFDAIEEGIIPSEAISFSHLEEEQKQRARDLIALNISDESAIDIAGLSEENFNKAEEMVNQGVYPEFITDIINIENNTVKVPEYDEYRRRGYSKTTSYSLAMLTDKEIDDFAKIMERNPNITDFFKDEYRVEIVSVQNTNAVDSVLKKDIYTPNGTKITLAYVFGYDGYQTKSRIEETKRHMTSSFMSKKSDGYRIKYNKYGDIREMARFITDKKTNAVTGVEYTKESLVLPGAYETVLYSINDFKTDTDDLYIDEDISKSVTTKGKTISEVKKEADGTVVFNEEFEYEGCTTTRHYKENRDENGNLLSNYYSYKITDEDNTVLMDTERSFTRLNDGSSINKINGNEYKLTYNDENMIVNISDGKRTRTLNFRHRIKGYAQDTLWKVIKQLPADTLLTLDKNINRWNYCEDNDSIASSYTRVLSAGTNINIIEHETGHFKDFEINEISDKPEFLDIYLDEMEVFFDTIPNNEQEFVIYCTPKTVQNNDGADEFVAEANMILSSYGNTSNHLRTRPQFLVRYFPRSIAKMAELSGKNSRKSLLE